MERIMEITSAASQCREIAFFACCNSNSFSSSIKMTDCLRKKKNESQIIKNKKMWK